MVPHRNMLRVLALLAIGRPAGRDHALALSEALSARFPVSLDDFLEEEVYRHLPFPLSVRLQTSDAAIDAEAAAAAFDAAGVLGVDRFLRFETVFQLQLALSQTLHDWREEKSLRVFIETCALAGIPTAIIAEDLRQLWGWDFDEGSIEEMRHLFADRTLLRGPNWRHYEAAIGPEEAALKRGLLSQPHDFVRWRLGVPLELDSDRVLNRLMSDAYYTERLLKSQSGEMGIRLTKDELARIKLERDTLFKALDRKTKLQEVEAAGGGTDANVASLLANISLKYDDEERPHRSFDSIAEENAATIEKLNADADD